MVPGGLKGMARVSGSYNFLRKGHQIAYLIIILVNSFNPQTQLQPMAVLVSQLVLPKEGKPWTSIDWRDWLESWVTAP